MDDEPSIIEQNLGIVEEVKPRKQEEPAEAGSKSD